MLLACSPAAIAQTASTQARAAPRFDPGTLASRADILAVTNHAASAEVARLRAMESDPGARDDTTTNISPNWVSGTFLIGALRATGAADVQAYVSGVARRFNYALGGDGAPATLLFADHQTIGDAYLTLYERNPQPGFLMPLKDRMDFNLRYLAMTPAPERLVWWWCDALFMAPAVYARMSAITGDRKYIDTMDAQYWRTVQALWDPAERLFYRDGSFIGRRSENEKKIFWSRGQGWVIAGLARILETMPADYPSRPKFIQLYRQLAERLAGLQQPDGLWRASLLDSAAFPEPETSGTALNTYAIAFGINHGLLDRAQYLPVVTRAWAGLNAYVLPNGILGQAQGRGDKPAPTRPETITLYASGAFLLAGTEMARLHDPVLALPLIADPSLRDEQAVEPWVLNSLAYNPAVHDPDYVSPITGKLATATARIPR